MTQKKSNRLPLVAKVNIVIIVAAVLFLVLCYFSTRETAADSLTESIEPFGCANLEDGSREYFLDLRDYDYHYTGIKFYTSHQIVTVYNAGREIYSFNKTGGAFTSTTGSTWNFIPVNERMIQIAVIIKPIYGIVDNQVPEFFIGSAYQMYDEVMIASMPRFIVSLLIVIMSILLFVYYYLMHEKQKLTKELLHLACFSLFCGIWSLNETDVTLLLSSNKIVDSIIPYLCLMLVIPPFVQFFDSYLNINCNHVKKYIIWASLVQFVVLTTLHFMKIAEFRETLIIMQVMLIIASLYMVAGVIGQIVMKKYSRRLEICAIGLSLFMMTIIVDVVQYYTKKGDADRTGRYVFLIFIFLIAWDMIKEANEVIEKGKRAKQLEIFALTDSMTGLLNRNAFESHAKSADSLDGVIAVVADANGLKYCNDTFGHEAGDEYITLVADVFNDVYGKYGNCYRTGGDEFCCIIQESNQVNIERLRKMFLTKIHTADLEGGHEYNIGVAIGDACYDSKVDGDFRSLVKRADACMYENKRLSKTS